MVGLLDYLGGNQPGGLYQQLLGNNRPQTGLGAYLQNSQDAGNLALSAPPPQQQPPQQMAPPPPMPSGMPPAMGGSDPNIPMTPMSNMAAAAHVSKPGFFGKGGNGWNVLGAIGDGLAAFGGRDPLYYNFQKDARDEQNKENNVVARLIAEQRAKQLYPEPTSIERNKGYFDRVDPTGKLGTTYLNAEANPQTLVTNPADGSVMFAPKGGIPSAASAAPPAGFKWNGRVYTGQGDYNDPRNWLPDTGGQSPAGSGGFPGSR